MAAETVAKLEDLPEGRMVRRTVGGREVAICKRGDEVVAFDAICPHRGGALDSGDIEGDNVFCPWHGWDFDIHTGKSACFPARIFVHKVTVQNGEVQVELNMT